MNCLKKLLLLFVATCFANAPLLSAQDAPPAPRIEASRSVEQKQDGQDAGSNSKQEEEESAGETKPSTKQKTEQDESSGEKSKMKSDEDEQSDDKTGKAKKAADQKADDKKADDKKADDKKADDKKADDRKADDRKADDKKADDKKADDKKAGDKKADDKKADDKKADKSKADGEKDEDEKSVAEKALDRLRRVRGIPDGERVDKFSKQSDGFVKIFEPVVESVNASTLTIMAGKRAIALGTVVDSNGLVLTKASEMRGSLGCKLVDGTILEAKVIGIDPETDLALLKIEAENLNVAQWSDEPPPVTGRWLATPKGSSNSRPTIGVVSVNERKIPPSRPFIGIEMVNLTDGPGVRINKVTPSSPADFADLLVNDVIVSIDEIEVKDILSVQKALGQYDVNDRITVGVLRGEKKLNIRLTLASRDKVAPDNRRSIQQNSMGSILSRRRKDFPTAFQHDSMLSSKTCGGPIVDLSGKIVGINIARAGRVSSLALPAYKVREIVELLKTGNLAPEVVNKEAIEKISAELEDMSAKYDHLPGKKEVLERKYNVEIARMDELNKSIAELKKRLEVIEEKSSNYKAELKAVRKQIFNVEKNRQRLEEDRERLRNGSR